MVAGLLVLCAGGCVEDPVVLMPVVTTAPVSTTTTTTTTSTTTTTTREPSVYVASREPRVVTATTTTVPRVLTQQYDWYQRGGDVIELQMVLGLRSVDGVYGPQTRAAHFDRLGGAAQAVSMFYPEFGGSESSDGQTLGELIDRYFRATDRPWARRVAFCESSAQTHDTESEAVSSALAIGWFQHLARYWAERSEKAGVPGASPFNSEANVVVAAWLFYEGGGARHWNPSRTCWEKES